MDKSPLSHIMQRHLKSILFFAALNTEWSTPAQNWRVFAYIAHARQTRGKKVIHYEPIIGSLYHSSFYGFGMVLFVSRCPMLCGYFHHTLDCGHVLSVEVVSVIVVIKYSWDILYLHIDQKQITSRYNLHHVFKELPK